MQQIMNGCKNETRKMCTTSIEITLHQGLAKTARTKLSNPQIQQVIKITDHKVTYNHIKCKLQKQMWGQKTRYVSTKTEQICYEREQLHVSYSTSQETNGGVVLNEEITFTY